MQKKIDEGKHIQNITKVIPKIKILSHIRANRVYQSKIRQQIVESERNLNFEIDTPFNFYYYMPRFNP